MGTTSYRAFARHTQATVRDFRRLGKKFSREARQHDMRGVKTSMAGLRRWTTAEQEWLTKNQPDDCYRPIHDTWSRFVDKMDEALDVLAEAIASKDDSEGSRAVSLLHESIAILEAHNAPEPDCGRQTHG